jgi:hypothetical protein
MRKFLLKKSLKSLSLDNRKLCRSSTMPRIYLQDRSSMFLLNWPRAAKDQLRERAGLQSRWAVRRAT